MAINFTPFEELFAHEYQSTYISLNGHIIVGPYTYSVFANYTIAERQAAFQACEKYLNWQVSEIQEEWELCMYMYQFIIKSPDPFPYLEYTLNEDIMAITWDVTITPINVSRKTASILGVRTDDGTNDVTSFRIDTAILDTTNQKLAARQQLRDMHLAYIARTVAIATYIGSMEIDAKNWLEAQE